MSTRVGGTTAITAGAVAVPVAFAGTVATPYQVLNIIPGWATTPFVVPSSKVSSGFTASFTVPPGADTTFDWEILAPTPAASTLATYLACVRDKLRDYNDVYWTAARKVTYINAALQKRDRDTAQNRILIPFTSTIGQDSYTLSDLGNQNVFDIIGVNLLYQNLRVVMGCVSFSELNASIRQYQPVFAWAPVAYARYSPTTIYVAPAPAIAYTLEFDCAQITPSDFLVNLTDTDPLPAPYDAPVCYWACHLAKINERKYDEADYFEQLYNDEIAKLDSNKVGMVPSLYSGRAWSR